MYMLWTKVEMKKTKTVRKRQTKEQKYRTKLDAYPATDMVQQ